MQTASAGARRLALLICAPGALVATPSHATDYELWSVGLRARVGEKRVLGEVAPESFRAYDVSATIRLPLEPYLPQGWGLRTRLMASAGTLHGADKTALTLSLVPLLAIDPFGGRFTFDAGIGLAVLSEHRYAQQDFGGPLQYALTVGASVVLHERVALGYRFMHYSDAGAYGNGTIGADFHMLEVSYRF